MQPQLQLGNSYSKSTPGRLKWHPFTYNLYGFCFRPKKIFLFPEMRVTRKIFTRAAAKFFLTRFSGYIIFSSLVSFTFLYSCFFVVACLFFEIKNMYSDTHSTMRAGDFHPTDFHSKTPAPESLF